MNEPLTHPLREMHTPSSRNAARVKHENWEKDESKNGPTMSMCFVLSNTRDHVETPAFGLGLYHMPIKIHLSRMGCMLIPPSQYLHPKKGSERVDKWIWVLLQLRLLPLRHSVPIRLLDPPVPVDIELANAGIWTQQDVPNMRL